MTPLAHSAQQTAHWRRLSVSWGRTGALLAVTMKENKMKETEMKERRDGTRRDLARETNKEYER